MGRALTICLLLLAACTAAPPAPTDPKQVWCDQNAPRRPSVAVVTAMTRAELDEINAYNARGAAWCGWTP